MNSDDMKILSSLVDTIRKKGSVTATELWKNTDLSIWQFEKIKKYIPLTFDDIILDRKRKSYVSRDNLSLFSEESLK